MGPAVMFVWSSHWSGRGLVVWDARRALASCFWSKMSSAAREALVEVRLSMVALSEAVAVARLAIAVTVSA